MAKSTYLSNSAKILAVLSGMLLLTNILVAVGSIGNLPDVSRLATSFSNLCLYVVLVMGYVAFNGEAVGHKRNHDRKKKRVLGFFKLLLFFCFILRYIKSIPEGLAMSVPSGTFGGFVARLGVSLMSTAGSFGFLFGALSLWYIIRDKGNLKLMLPELVSLFISILYNIFKFFNYAVGKYGITEFGETFTEVFSNNDISQILCIFQFLFNLIMLISIVIFYGRKGDEEQKILDKNVKELSKARNILKEEGYGIDTLEDDFLLLE